MGFNSRNTLLEYQKKPEFKDTITRAKTKIEAYAESRLYDKDGVRGAEFTLRCNYGWRDKQDINLKIVEEDDGLIEALKGIKVDWSNDL